MSRRILTVIACLALVAVLGGCDSLKPTAPTNQDYVGNWVQPSGTLNIDAEGNVAYEEHSGASTSIQAPAQAWADDSFLVGALGVNTTFRVDEAPHQDAEGAWKMKVDGIEYTRQ